MKKLLLLLISLPIFSSCSNHTNSTLSSSINSSSSIDISSKWGEQGEVFVEKLHTDLPYIECDEFVIEVSKDNYGDPLIELYCYFEDSLLEKKINEYASICESDNYLVSLETIRQPDETGLAYIEFEMFFADKLLDNDLGVELQFLIGNKNNRDCIGIFAFNYPVYDQNKWPSSLVKYVLGHDVPHLPENNYVYNATIGIDNDIKYVYIAMSNTTEEDEEALKNILLSESFLIDDTEYDEFGYLCYDSEKTYCLQFKFDYTYYFMEFYIFPIY